MSYTPQGLVTVAYLKTQLDAGHDHLSLFEPLIIDALNHLESRDLIASDIRQLISERTNLQIPVPTVQTLLGRCAKYGYLERKGGRFHKTNIGIPPSNIAEIAPTIKEGQNRLGAALLAYSSKGGISFTSPEEAVQRLAEFISANKLQLLLNQEPSESARISLKNTRNFARFITECCLNDEELNSPLKALLEGILLADVLLMRDIQSAELKFNSCQVFLDTHILLSALGLNGTADELATKEGLAAIRNAGAQTLAFERTVIEIRGILRVYEDRLGTSEGRLSLFPTSMTTYMIANRYSPADVRVIALELEQRLRRIGIIIQPFPLHVIEHTLDEKSLINVLSHGTPTIVEPRVRHDVDCAAAILTIRAGGISFDIERCLCVFSTTSGLVVRSIQEWYVNQQGKGISPFVHHAFLTTLAWLKKPSFSPDLKLHELAAVCYSAIRPTEATWERMLSALRLYVAEGRMSDDESVAIVANGLTESLLSQIDDDFESDAGSINEAIERVREKLRQEHLEAARIEIERVREESAGRVNAAQMREEAARQEAETAKKSASIALASATDANSKIDKLIEGMSKVAGLATRALILVILFAATVYSAFDLAHSNHHFTHWLVTVVLAAATIIGFLGSAWGISASSIGDRVQSWMIRFIRSTLV